MGVWKYRIYNMARSIGFFNSRGTRITQSILTLDKKGRKALLLQCTYVCKFCYFIWLACICSFLVCFIFCTSLYNFRHALYTRHMSCWVEHVWDFLLHDFSTAAVMDERLGNYPLRPLSASDFRRLWNCRQFKTVYRF